MPGARRRGRTASGFWQSDPPSNVTEKTSLRPATIWGIEGGEPGTQLRTLFDILSPLDMEMVVRPRTKGLV